VSDADLTFGATRLVGTATSTPAAGTSRLAPGSIIAGRYRLVALLGRGGMGEVYRADDLTLDQPVALKFLPEGVGGDSDKLAQFHNELRTARQVSHKNVVRLYDLGETNGRRFLTMEYVDGEDLASLLRRIGRIPQDKAIELARQLCAGVAAAHERGVLHRDLKPANLMIDGEGNVRITDFGIAAPAASVASGTEPQYGSVPVFAGTPQYMAPEQLMGQPASVRTDLYALGLVLFEIFTGRRAYDAKTLGDLKQLHDTGSVTTPSSVVRDLDPAVERVILRCLDKDPQKRPGSALAVAAALPGGDPLAAALAAGETPSPAMLVAAGESEALAVGGGLAAVAFVAIGVIALAFIATRISITGRVPLDKPPAVLADRVQQFLKSVGYTEPVADSASGLARSDVFLRWLPTVDQRPQRWDILNTGSPWALVFWHRTSPRPLVTSRTQIQVTIADPPMAVSGMTLVIVDTLGRVVEFQVVPSQFDSTPPPESTPPWDKLFEAAGLDMKAFTPVDPQWSPRDFADTRAAWEGPLTDHPEYRVRVEAAAYRGRPTSLFVLGPWARPTRMAPVTRTTAQTLLSGFVSLAVVALAIAALLIARWNVRAKRADTRGAGRLSLFLLTGYTVCWVIAAHHVPDVNTEMNFFIRNMGPVLFVTAVGWLMYTALEPYVRRFWPDGILGWTRLMSGYIRDPRVGRDVLIGCTIAVGLALLEALYHLLPPLFGRPSALPTFQSNVAVLAGGGTLVSTLFDQGLVSGIFQAMFGVLAYVLLRLAFRRTALAVIASAVLLGLVQTTNVLTSVAPTWIAALNQVIVVTVVVTMVVRYGLLVSVIVTAVDGVLESIPLTLSLSHWTATASNLTMALVIGLVCFGFYAARAGQPLFGDFGDKVKS
jgi:eukaryotic-like serine/threonine-protein kinase